MLIKMIIIIAAATTAKTTSTRGRSDRIKNRWSIEKRCAWRCMMARRVLTSSSSGCSVGGLLERSVQCFQMSAAAAGIEEWIRPTTSEGAGHCYYFTTADAMRFYSIDKGILFSKWLSWGCTIRMPSTWSSWSGLELDDRLDLVFFVPKSEGSPIHSPFLITCDFWTMPAHFLLNSNVNNLLPRENAFF